MINIKGGQYSKQFVNKSKVFVNSLYNGLLWGPLQQNHKTPCHISLFALVLIFFCHCSICVISLDLDGSEKNLSFQSCRQEYLFCRKMDISSLKVFASTCTFCKSIRRCSSMWKGWVNHQTSTGYFKLLMYMLQLYILSSPIMLMVNSPFYSWNMTYILFK